MDTAQRLQDAEVPAMVHVPVFGWWHRHFLSDFYANDYETITGFDDAPGMSALDEACAIHTGFLSTEDPRFMAWWPVFKEFTDLWVQDYIARPPDDNQAATQDFIAGSAAMVYQGSWLPNQLRDAGIAFEYGSFNFPTLGPEVTEYSTGTNVSNAVGGPNAAYQYAVSTPQANKTMEEPGKMEAVLDWLRYIGTPEVVEKVVNEDGSFIPTWPGTAPDPSMELLVEQANQPLRVIQIGNSSPILSTDADLQRIFGLYLSGNSSLEQATTEIQQLLDRGVQDYAQKNNVDLEAECN